MDKYILTDRRVAVKCNDLEKWGRMFEGAHRRVAFDTIKGVEVSTVFLGIDHSFGYGPPKLFETMIFGGPYDRECKRCSTWEEAEEQHKQAVRLVEE